ncbi:MAG: hypothetical protein E7L00_11235 [Propionibacteriaceae bacterium]|nr:hypothetical protein [Propionibacteriaceae bacterium]
MTNDAAPRWTSEKQVPFLWIILYLGSLGLGLALAGLTMPVPGGVVLLVRVGFGTVLVLCLVLVAIASWRQTKALRELRRVSPSPWRWIALLAAVVAAVLVWTWATGVQAEASEKLARLGTTMLTAVLLGLAISVGTHALVKILAAGTADAPTR